MPRQQRAWWLALTGLFVSVFSVVALSGPGRIDIVDAQTRYEVSRSLVEHGDHVIRDANVWFVVFPGRDGQLYTTYRFPQSAAGVAAILAADATGPTSEPRRHFFFALIGAVACGVLALTYAAWFRHLGHSPRSALLWAAGGILCTPSWFYGASTFDDILGSAAVVLAVALAYLSRRQRPLWGAAGSGLALGLAVNCKQPLGFFVLAVLAACYDHRLRLRQQWGRFAWVLAGLALGVAAYKGYDLYKFPPGTMEQNAELLEKYGPIWSSHPGQALLTLMFSTGAGVLLYCPPLAISLSGIPAWWRSNRWFCAAMATAAATFILFIASLAFYKGDPAWGPRYLTPVFAAMWLMAPAGARVLRRSTVTALLVLGFLVQLLALSVDPSRLYVARGIPSTFGIGNPLLYFNPALSHLVNRPREILEIATSAGERGPAATFAFPAIDFVEKGSGAMLGHRAYSALDSFRPWWAGQGYFGDDERPVDFGRTATLLIILTGVGLTMQVYAVRHMRLARQAKLWQKS